MYIYFLILTVLVQIQMARPQIKDMGAASANIHTLIIPYNLVINLQTDQNENILVRKHLSDFFQEYT